MWVTNSYARLLSSQNWRGGRESLQGQIGNWDGQENGGKGSYANLKREGVKTKIFSKRNEKYWGFYPRMKEKNVEDK